MSFEPRDYLRHILIEADYLIEWGAGLTFDVFLVDETLRRAFVRSLEIIGERAEEHEAEFRLGNRVYLIRLEFAEPDYCDAVITLTSGGRIQKLFDATAPGVTKDPALIVACDDPHFRIHWAGDLDRDGGLDMLVTFSRKYSYLPNQLLVSSAARSGELVAEVGRYERFSQ